MMSVEFRVEFTCTWLMPVTPQYIGIVVIKRHGMGRNGRQLTQADQSIVDSSQGTAAYKDAFFWYGCYFLYELYDINMRNIDMTVISVYVNFFQYQLGFSQSCMNLI